MWRGRGGRDVARHAPWLFAAATSHTHLPPPPPHPLHPTQLYGAKPAACAGVLEIKVKTVPVAVGDVDAPKELVVTPDGKIAAIGGTAPGASAHHGLSKGAAAAVAIVMVAVVVAVVVGGVIVAKKKGSRRVLAK